DFHDPAENAPGFRVSEIGGRALLVAGNVKRRVPGGRVPAERIEQGRLSLIRHGCISFCVLFGPFYQKKCRNLSSGKAPAPSVRGRCGARAVSTAGQKRDTSRLPPTC